MIYRKDLEFGFMYISKYCIGGKNWNPCQLPLQIKTNVSLHIVSSESSCSTVISLKLVISFFSSESFPVLNFAPFFYLRHAS